MRRVHLISCLSLYLYDTMVSNLQSPHITLTIISDAYDSDEIIIKWNGPNPVDVNPEIRMPDMRLRTILHTIRNDTYATGYSQVFSLFSLPLANFSLWNFSNRSP